MNLSNKNILANLIVFITIISVNELSNFPIGNTFSSWCVYFITILFFLNGIKYYYSAINNENFLLIKIYLGWLVIVIVRGIFEAQNYWDFKSLINNSLALMLVLSVYVFTNPAFVQFIFSKWLKFALPLFIVFMFFITKDSYGFYLVPISFFMLFNSHLDKKWRIVILCISLIVVFVALDARSNVIKFTVPFLLSFLIYFKRYLKLKIFKILLISGFSLPFVFLALGITNIFNVFQMDKYIKGTYTKKVVISGRVEDANLKADTRTFLYKEVVTSAIKNNYVLIGRSPARGNESEAFGLHAAEELKTGRYERYSNEVSVLNIFTWTGLIGLILYLLVFLKAAYLAIAKSNSNFLRILGLYLTFRWIYSWVEDPNTFNINNILLWMVIAMCYSVQFRNMSDSDFKNWMNSIFKGKPYLNSGI
jgi:hypothetical protein